MKNYSIIIEINRPISDVFEFTVNPDNTHLWIDSIIEERTNTKQVGLGTEYSQKVRIDDGRIGTSKAVITGFKLHEFIEFSFVGTTYKCKYTYTPSKNGTRLVYYEEAIEDNDLKNPMERYSFERLKSILECTSLEAQ